MLLQAGRESLFSELARPTQSHVDGMRGTATITESIETSDTDEAVTQLLLSAYELR